jgi:hypothetical protein
MATVKKAAGSAPIFVVAHHPATPARLPISAPTIGNQGTEPAKSVIE